MKRPRIALFGIFGLQNLGNECTLHAMAHNVRQRRPHAEIYSICYDPRDTSQRHDLPAVPVTSPYSAHTAAGRAHRGKMIRLLRIAFRRLPSELRHWFRAFRILWRTDLLVMTGTGMLTDYGTSSFAYPYDVFKWTATAKLAGCKVRFVSIGVGSLDRRLSRRLIKWALILADYRSYRDDVSKARAQKLGFDTRKDPVFPDLAFSLPASIFPGAAGHERQRRVVGVAVMDHLESHAPKGQGPKSSHDAYLDKMCDFAAWLVQRGYGVRILQGDAKYDPPVRREFRARLEGRGLTYGPGAILDEDSTSVGELLRHIGLSDVVVSPRFHNLILALMLDKPVISISYDAKNDALLEGFGMGKYCQRIEALDVERLIDQFVDLEQDVEKHNPPPRWRAEEYRHRLDEQYRLVLDDV